MYGLITTKTKICILKRKYKMTKSQKTKNAQLTEQFNHGLLPDGWYYYKASDGRSDIATEYGLFCIEADNKVKVEVLEKVPSYSEYLALQSDSLAKNEAVEINAELEVENARLKTEYEKECKRADELEDSYWKEVEKNKKLKKWCEEFNALEVAKENTKLKELLKECKPYINHSAIRNRFRNSAGNKKDMKLLTKIDEVI